MLFRDIRYAFRVLRANPGFTAIAIISLALGIGVNSSMFGLADALLLRPLPVPDSSRIATVSDSAPDLPIGAEGFLSYSDYVDLRDKNKSFEGLIAATYTFVGMAEQPNALPQLKMGQTVSGNFFRALGVDPMLGRSFSADEDRVPGRDAVVILAYDTWKQQFSADPKIIGRRIRLNNIEFTIIGVTGKDFTGLDPLVHPEMYLPAMMLARVSPATAGNPFETRDARMFTVKGRLKPGITVEQANAEMATIANGLAAAYPKTNRNHGVIVRTEVQSRVVQRPLNASFAGMLLTVAGLVLVIACANVANLLLSRAQSRTREMAVRLAIGASRRRLIRQLLTESLLLALAGGALGLLVALYGSDYFNRLRLAGDLPVSLVVKLDHRVLVFSLIVAMLSALLFGLAPAIRSARTDLVPALKTGEPSGWRRRTWGRSTLVIAQVALALILLSATSVFVRTLNHVITSDPGFRTDHLLMMSFDPSLVRDSPDQARDFYRSVTDRVRQIPGVVNAALSRNVPFDGANVVSMAVVPEGYQFPKGKESDSLLGDIVSDRYFETMGTPVVRGRAIGTRDTATSPHVAVINQFMADQYWPHQDPIGKRFQVLGADGGWVQVVGITRMGTYLAFGEPQLSFFYLPMSQQPSSRMTLLVETSGDAAALTSRVRGLVRSIDPHQPVYSVRTMREYFRTQGLLALHLIVNVVGGMGILGLAMALVGLYALVSYSVSRRTREIGIRMAIGAERRDILRIVLGQGMTLAIIGVGLGWVGTWGAIRGILVLFSRIQNGTAFDPWTFIAVPAALLAVTLAASFIPAHRASTIDPNQALHYE